MNNTLFYVLKWIYSQSSYHWYVRRFKYVWHKERVELTDGWFCWYRSWRGNLSTVNWQITEIKERSITSLAWFRQKKTHSSTGLPAALSHPIRVKKRHTEQSEAVGVLMRGWTYRLLTRPKARNADSAVSAQKCMQERAALFLCWDRHRYKGGFLKKNCDPASSSEGGEEAKWCQEASPGSRREDANIYFVF